MKIKEAKTKWCPFSRVANVGYVVAANRVFTGDNNTELLPPATMCVADKCMLWEWVHIEDEPGVGYCGMSYRSD